MQRRTAAGWLGDEVEELAAACRPGDPRATQRGQRRLIRLEHRELGYVGAVYLAADGSLTQIGGERLHLGQFRHT